MTSAFRQALRQLAAAIKAERNGRHPYVVCQHGLTRQELGEEHFITALAERRGWVEEHRSASFSFDVLPCGTGREYMFESYYDAFLFKMRFGSRVVPQAEAR